MENKKSLIDVVNPDNQLLSYKILANGVQYRFAGRVLPEWFKELAKSLNYAMVDNDVAQRRSAGRTVSLVENKHRSREFWNS